MLTWHFDVSSNLISLYQIYFVSNKMFLFHKIKNNQLLKSFSIGSMETLTLICYCKCILIVNFVSRNVSYVVMYILWTFCYINCMNVTNIDLCDSFIEVETFSHHHRDFLFLRDWAENRKKLSRWIDFSFNSLDGSGYFLVVGICNH